MKRNTFLLLALTLPIFGFSQGVKANIYDKFLKKQRIEMAPVVISGLEDKNSLSIDFTAIGGALYLNLTGAGWGASTVDKDNELVLLFSNNSSLTIKSASLQSFEPGLVQNFYRHQYFLRFQDLDLLSKSDLTGLRKYSFDTYSEITLSKENHEGLKKLSSSFLEELKKANINTTVREISVRDVQNHIGDSVTFCSKVYRTRFFQESEGGPTLLDLQADFSDPFINVVILAKDRQKFNNAPETIYLNKDVCISGVVRLRNNSPYLIIQNKEQIRVKSPVNRTEVVRTENDSLSAQNVQRASLEGQLKETLAQFPGGDDSLRSFLEKNLILPAKAKGLGKKQLIASFEIDAQGNCSNISIVESAGLLDEEAKKVLMAMPKWRPAFSHGRFIATRITYPINL